MECSTLISNKPTSLLDFVSAAFWYRKAAEQGGQAFGDIQERERAVWAVRQPVQTHNSLNGRMENMGLAKKSTAAAVLLVGGERVTFPLAYPFSGLA
jgi:hypothetical protein